MIQRSKHPRQKDVMCINDVPVKLELKDGEKFSSASNTGLLTSLRTGRVNNFNSNKVENHKGIISVDIFYTYLDYTYYGESEDVSEVGIEKNFDFNLEFKKRKDLVVESVHIDSLLTQTLYFLKDDENKDAANSYHLIPHQKDLYVSTRLYNCICETLEEIRKVNPKLIILTGKWSLFLLCGVGTFAQNMSKGNDRKPLGGLATYRSSILSIHPSWGEFESIVVPVYHPVHAMGMQDKLPVIELDMQRIGWLYHTILEKGVKYFKKPNKTTIIGSTLEKITQYFDELFTLLEQQQVKIACDIETKFSTVIDCIGFAYKKEEAICIPFATKTNPNFWSLEEEGVVLKLLLKLFNHPNAIFILQNGSYDAQFIFKFWGIRVKLHHDTMILAHLLNNFLPKSLDFLASLYCTHYSYWKNMQNFKE